MSKKPLNSEESGKRNYDLVELEMQHYTDYDEATLKGFIGTERPFEYHDDYHDDDASESSLEDDLADEEDDLDIDTIISPARPMNIFSTSSTTLPDNNPMTMKEYKKISSIGTIGGSSYQQQQQQYSGHHDQNQNTSKQNTRRMNDLTGSHFTERNYNMGQFSKKDANYHSLDDYTDVNGNKNHNNSNNSMNQSISLDNLLQKGRSMPNRMVDRDGDFHQSRGKISVRKRIKRKDWRSLYGYDMFHSLVNAPTLRTVSILLFLYFFLVVIFGIAYYIIARLYGCNLGIENCQEAFLFSLETMATVGYGTQDVFFDDCLLPAIVLTCQMLVRIVCDAVTIGIIYSRLSRPTTRASTIVFSNYAIIRRIRGKLYFMFQLCELRKHQLVEAHVRLYLVKQDRYLGSGEDRSSHRTERDLSEIDIELAGEQFIKPKVHFQTCSLRVNHPNDDTGSMLLMCLPQVVVHEIDASSALMPPPRWIETKHIGEPGHSPYGIQHRWAPPAYRFAETFPSKLNENRNRTFGDHEREHLSDEKTLRELEYDTDIINNIVFPSVNQRNPYNFVNTRQSKEAPYSEGMKIFEHYYNPNMTAGEKKHNGDEKVKGDKGKDKEDEMKANNKFSKDGNDEHNESFHENGKSTYPDELPWQREERRMIQKYMKDRHIEVIAVVEGMDSATGGVVQARHSFIIDEIKWNRTFEPCVHEDSEEGVAVIDFSSFHKVKRVPADSAFPGLLASYI
jgi:hypothetical protein